LAYLFDEHDDLTRSGPIRVRAVRAWRQRVERAERVDELVADAAAVRERLAWDQEVVAVLQVDGFDGPSWEAFAEALVAYAYQYLLAWIRSGLIGARCRERGIRLPAGSVAPLEEEDAIQLTEEVLTDAVLGFQELLRQGRWSPTGGASLTTYFVGQCITRFPNLYRAWRATRWPTSWAPLSELDRDSARVVRAERQIDPAEAAVAAAELRRVAGQLDQRTLHAVVLQAMGYQVVEIAELLGETPKAIEMVLYHHRRRRRDEGGTA
jgi:hypothetical protein